MAQYCHASHEVYHEGVAQRAHNLSPVPFGAAKSDSSSDEDDEDDDLEPEIRAGGRVRGRIDSDDEDEGGGGAKRRCQGPGKDKSLRDIAIQRGARPSSR